MSQRRSDYPYVIAVVFLWPTELAADCGLQKDSSVQITAWVFCVSTHF